MCVVPIPSVIYRSPTLMFCVVCKVMSINTNEKVVKIKEPLDCKL